MSSYAEALREVGCCNLQSVHCLLGVHCSLALCATKTQRGLCKYASGTVRLGRRGKMCNVGGKNYFDIEPQKVLNIIAISVIQARSTL